MAIYNGGLNIIAPDISGKEDKSNKVTTWSSTTTDAHYPSEKLVKGALDTKVNTANVLTPEEIHAAADLTGKVASAIAVKTKIDGFSGGFGNNSSTAIFLPDNTTNSTNLMLFFSTFNACGLYIIRKESASAIFILPVKEATGFTVTKGDNALILNNTTDVGGVYTLLC